MAIALAAPTTVGEPLTHWSLRRLKAYLERRKIAALTGAASAALLSLVCEVVERHRAGTLTPEREAARGLQQQLLGLVDENAAAFRAFLDSELGSSARRTAGARAAVVQLEIGRAFSAIVQLAAEIAPHVEGDMQLDVGAARRMARAAAQSALDIAEHNLSLADHALERQTFQREIAKLKTGSGA